LLSFFLPFSAKTFDFKDQMRAANSSQQIPVSIPVGTSVQTMYRTAGGDMKPIIVPASGGQQITLCGLPQGSSGQPMIIMQPGQLPMQILEDQCMQGER
jgi:hypothetical protein